MSLFCWTFSKQNHLFKMKRFACSFPLIFFFSRLFKVFGADGTNIGIGFGITKCLAVLVSGKYALSVHMLCLSVCPFDSSDELIRGVLFMQWQQVECLLQLQKRPLGVFV